jgi:hypothetical protein
MNESAIVAHKVFPADAKDELERLGYEFAEAATIYCQKIVAGQTDHWELAEFATFAQIPVYKYQPDKRFLLFAVLDDGEGERTICWMLAGRSGAPCTIGEEAWDGHDFNALRDDFLQPRMLIRFS